MSKQNFKTAMSDDATHGASVRYIKWFMAFFLPLCLTVLVFKRSDIFPWVGDCDARGYDAEHYLAYCHTPRYGDSEHYAFIHNTEARQLEGLQSAEVLFLGNSRTQFAFSTTAVKNYFASLQRRFFLLGFGLGGKIEIPIELFTRFEIKPKVLVINADPFFSNEQNNTLDRVLENADTTQWEHHAKRFLQKQQSSICQRAKPGGMLSGLLCEGRVPTLFRSRDTGFWLTDYYVYKKAIPVTFNDSLLDTVSDRMTMVDEFISLSGVARECVIITVTPHTGTPQEFSAALAKSAGLPAFFPEVQGLVTIDDSHLNSISAERWSAAFLAEANATIKQCLES